MSPLPRAAATGADGAGQGDNVPNEIVLDSSFLEPRVAGIDGNGDDVDDASTSSPSPCPSPVLIVLNYRLPRLTAALWHRARLVVVADGGADRLMEASERWRGEFGGLRGDDENGPPSSPPFVPDAIVGDLDSISAEARSHYESLGVRVVDLGGDQDTTDLQKCLSFAAAEVERESTSSSSPSPPRLPPVFVAGALGGRLDHTLSAISTLYAIEAAKKKKKKKGSEDERGFADAAATSLGSVVLSGDGSLATLVPSTDDETFVRILPCASVEGPGCGLVALGCPAGGVETEGLEWNLGRGGDERPRPPLEVGGLQSTSNRIASYDGLRVRSPTEPLLWTTAMKEEWS